MLLSLVSILAVSASDDAFTLFRTYPRDATHPLVAASMADITRKFDSLCIMLPFPSEVAGSENRHEYRLSKIFTFLSFWVLRQARPHWCRCKTLLYRRHFSLRRRLSAG